MTRNYTALCSFDLSKRLKEAGFPQTPLHDWYGLNGELNPFLPDEESLTDPYFSEVFDWLMEKGIPELNVTFYPALFEDDEETYGFTMTARLPNKNTEGYFYHPYSTSFNKRYCSWTEAAAAAIEKALEIMEGSK